MEYENNIRRYYRTLYQKYGIDERSLGWTKKKQSIRFRQLLRFLDMKNASILDVGCGFGDLLTYCTEHYRHNFDYYGVDTSSEFIEIAQKAHKGYENRFCVGNFMEDGPWAERHYDYIVESGIFGFRCFKNDEMQYQYIENVTKRALALCKRGGGLRLTSSRLRRIIGRPKQIFTQAPSVFWK